MAQTERKALLTPRFRVAFPQIIEPKVFAPGQKPRYSVVALFNPKAFSEKEKKQFGELMAEINKVCVETFKKPLKELDRAIYKRPFHDGKEKAQYNGFGEGIVYCTMSAYVRQPGVVGINNERINPSEIYPGCYARASVNPFANGQWKSISIGVNNIQKLGDGDRLDGATSAEEDFGSDPLEYEDSDLGLGTEETSDEEAFA